MSLPNGPDPLFPASPFEGLTWSPALCTGSHFLICLFLKFFKCSWVHCKPWKLMSVSPSPANIEVTHSVAVHHQSFTQPPSPTQLILSLIDQESQWEMNPQFSSVTQSCLTLWPHGLQHARLPCPSPTPRPCSNSCPSHRWCHWRWHLILYHPLLLPPSIFPSIRVFSNESVLRIRWPKYWSFSFSISPSNEHPGLISFRMN